MMKLIASDLDGTLLRNDAQSLNPEVFELIRTLKQNGILFVAASGRQYQNMRRLFGPVSDDIGYICENGTLGIYHGEIFSEEHIPDAIGHELFHAVRAEKGCELLLSTRKTHYIENPSAQYEHHMRHVVGNDVVTVDDIFAVEEPYLKISACNFDGIAYLAPSFQDRFSDRLNVALAGKRWLDTMPKGVHKGHALDKLLSRLGISPDECLAFGDQYNDVEMLKLAGKSCAMIDAVPGLLDIAGDTTEDVVSYIRKMCHFI